MKLIKLLTLFAATACLVSCGQKPSASSSNTTSSPDSTSTTETPATVNTQPQDEPTPETISSPWVFDGNRVVTKIEVITTEGGKSVSNYEYDSKGRLTKTTSTLSNGLTSIEEYDYTTMTGKFSDAWDDGSSSSWTSTFKADPSGRIIYERITKDSQDPYETIHNYNDKGQLTEVLNIFGDTVTTYYSWTEDGDLLVLSDVNWECGFSYGDIQNTRHQPFSMIGTGLVGSSVNTHFPISENGDGWSNSLSYELNEDGTINKVTSIGEDGKSVSTYTYGTL